MSVIIDGTNGITTPTGTGDVSVGDDLTFTGTGNRITGDFSNATEANRIAFQTSTTNGGTRVNIISNGTGTASSLDVFESSDPNNSSVMRIRQSNTESQIIASSVGTGSLRPLTFSVGGSERVRVDSSGNVGIGTSSPVGRLQINQQDGFVFNSASAISTMRFGSAGTAESTAELAFNRANGAITISQGITGSTLSERLRIDTSGNVGIGTSSPTRKLDVLGDVTVAGFYRNADVGVVGAAGMLVELGARSGSTRTAGGAIGAQLNNPATTGALQLYSRTGGALTEKVRIDSSGNLLVGKTSVNQVANGVELRPEGVLIATSPSDAGIFYRKTTTTVQGVILTRSDVGGTNTLVGAGFANGTFGTVSDQRKKKNIVDARNYLDDLMQLRVVKYNWITDAEDTPKELGWIAQEVEQVFPGMITEMEGNKMLKKEVFMPMMLKAIQEQQTLIQALTARIEALEVA